MQLVYAMIVNFIFGTIAWIFLTRLMLQLARAPFKNSFVQSLYLALAPILRPLEKFIPRYGNFNISCALLIYTTGLIWSIALYWQINLMTLINAFILVFSVIYWQLFALLMLYAVMSLFQPSHHNPMVQLVTAMANPIVAPFRRFVPRIGPLDFSVAVAILSITIVYYLLIQYLPIFALKLIGST
jgi:YggT family protein